MKALQNKVILILSPQSWGKMFVSKHHYAVELARYGNKVYFLNPPEKQLSKRVVIEQLGSDNLFVIRHRLFFPYDLKFHAPAIFHWLMKFQIKEIIKALGVLPDVVWSFDLGNHYPLHYFGGTPLKIFHPVDEPAGPQSIAAGKGADCIFSVTREILEKYRWTGVPLHFVNHGVSSIFLDAVPPQTVADGKLHFGFSGNLLRPDLDRPMLLSIIRANPELVFECWGSYETKDANIGGSANKETIDFITALKELPNLLLHGAADAANLASGLARMDGFLICYDVQKDQSRGTNYHKIMEYLAIGKVIVSNNVTTYKNLPELVLMVEEREDNHRMPELFRSVIDRIDWHNRPEAVSARKEFAASNTYRKQIERIEQLLEQLG